MSGVFSLTVFSVSLKIGGAYHTIPAPLHSSVALTAAMNVRSLFIWDKVSLDGETGYWVILIPFE